jgi:hypothetical protein
MPGVGCDLARLHACWARPTLYFGHHASTLQIWRARSTMHISTNAVLSCLRPATAVSSKLLHALTH